MDAVDLRPEAVSYTHIDVYKRQVKWKRFIGKNGVGVYEYDNGGDGWYRPHENCKMRFLGKQYAFCEVCKEQIRRTFCEDSDVTKIFFQTYADIFYESDTGKDMSEYFILRRGKNETTGDKLGDRLTLTYMTEDGQTLPADVYKRQKWNRAGGSCNGRSSDR